MNKYEEKFKQTWQSNVDRIARLTNETKSYGDKIAQTEKSINAIDTAKELLKESGSREAVSALKEKVSDLHQNRRNLQEQFDRLHKQMLEAKTEQRMLQNLCPHETTVHDHEDYHRREDFYRCTLCGDVR